ncbi:FixH family protein [Natribacillus halophilus]|uniref:YtkA-like n=1 Tax=Natribacillus halophilus TaxID=549003 RepID=A0A1G8LC57_9BACI|nr:FixH family protein [Natribacillus halophilus]SDI53318.1 YtkA-like [Natribacillus halophilus]
MKIKMLGSGLLIFLAAACGAEEDQSAGDPGSTEPIDVEVTMPEEMDTGDHTLETEVTQEDEAVTDADEVVFEVWEDGSKEDSDMIENETEDGGVYSADYTFDDDGIYLVQPHVTARGLHSMPVHSIVVGDVDQEEIDTFDEDDIEHESDLMDDHDDNEH